MTEKVQFNFNRFAKFFFPTLLGIILFAIPINYNGSSTLIFNVINTTAKKMLGEGLIPLTVIILIVSAVLSTIGFISKNVFKGFWGALFNCNLMNWLYRVLAAVFAVCTYFKVGPEFIWSADTGENMLSGVVAVLVTFFFFSSIFMQFLTKFGFMEFIGTLLGPIMKPLFKLPGRAAVNCCAAWAGSSSLSIITAQGEFKEGNYTKRQAVLVSTCLSVASIATMNLLYGFLGLGEYFMPLFLVSILLEFIMAAIMVRIPPIRTYSNDYSKDAANQGVSEDVPEGHSRLSWALESAMKRAENQKGNIVIAGCKTAVDIWLTLLPVIMTVGTVAGIIVFYTPIATYISMPITAVLNLLGIEQAADAGMRILLGWIDLFYPYIVGSPLTSIRTRVVVALTAQLQLLFLSETIPAVIRDKEIGLSFPKALLIALIRMILVIFLSVAVAYIMF